MDAGSPPLPGRNPERREPSGERADRGRSAGEKKRANAFGGSRFGSCKESRLAVRAVGGVEEGAREGGEAFGGEGLEQTTRCRLVACLGRGEELDR
eukprot:scaffold5691_cov25-Tisochrysis_lutea.AAC.3